MTFPEQPWLPFCKRPSQVIIEALQLRAYRRFTRNGYQPREAGFMADDYCKESELRKRHRLPTETRRVRMSLEQWDRFLTLNSRTSTRKEARLFAVKLLKEQT